MAQDTMRDIHRLRFPDNTGDISAMVGWFLDNRPGSRILEMGVGTGRIALPLAGAGFSVTGVDISTGFLQVLAEADTEGLVTARLASFTSDEFEPADFDAVLFMWNTLFYARDLTEQQAAMENAATSVADDGIVVVESFNPFQHLACGPRLSMRQLDSGTSVLEQTHVDVVNQMLYSHALMVGATAHETYRESLSVLDRKSVV